MNQNDASQISSETITWDSTYTDLSGIESFEMAISLSPDDSSLVSTWQTSQNNNFQIEDLNLLEATNYYSLVRSIDKAGNISNYAVSSPWQITQSISRINNLELSDRSSNNIIVGWSLPESNGQSIVSYESQFKKSSESHWNNYSNNLESSSTSLNFIGLDENTAYTFRIRSYNGINFSSWSNILEISTLPILEIFENNYTAINVGGAEQSKIVSIEDGNTLDIKNKNGITISSVNLNQNETFEYDSKDFDRIVATGPFYVAGRLGSIGANASDKANVTWSTKSWVGKEFYFNLTRNAPMSIKIFAFESSNIEIFKGNESIITDVILENSGKVIPVSDFNSYKIISDGLIVVYVYANLYTDPRPLLPASKDIIGFPSSKAMLTSSSDNNEITLYHGNSIENNLTMSLGITEEISPQGISDLFQSYPLRIIGNENIVANSNADSNGYCSAPFTPISMMKKKFAINVDSDYVAFASDQEVTITVIEPDLNTFDISLAKSGSSIKAPYSNRLSNLSAGTIFLGDKNFQAWYQPNSDLYGAEEDETILFGWD